MTDTFALSELAAIGRLDTAKPILDFSINPATHLGAAAMAYICARLLGASEEEACGASWSFGAASDYRWMPHGIRVALHVGARLGSDPKRTWAGKGVQGLDHTIPELNDLPDTPTGRAAAILAVTRRCVQESADDR